MAIVITLAVVAFIAVVLFSSSKPLSPIDELKAMQLTPKGKEELLKTIARLETGDAYASWLIGGNYEDGHIATIAGNAPFPKSKAKAIWWKRKSAEDGCGMAQYNLGRMYLYGEEQSDNLVEKNSGEALKWLHRAAENGEFYSLAALGEVYFLGIGVPQDFAKSFEWFSKSINHATARQYDFYDAGRRLGEMYAAGNGVDRDLVQAYKWMTIAGRDPDQHHTFPLKGRLSTAERANALHLAEEWRKRPNA